MREAMIPQGNKVKNIFVDPTGKVILETTTDGQLCYDSQIIDISEGVYVITHSQVIFRPENMWGQIVIVYTCVPSRLEIQLPQSVIDLLRESD